MEVEDSEGSRLATGMIIYRSILEGQRKSMQQSNGHCRLQMMNSCATDTIKGIVGDLIMTVLHC